MTIKAPKVDGLLRWFDRGYRNSSVPSEKTVAAMEPLFSALEPLAPLKKNDEVKSIWVKIPRGDISDYGSFEEMKDWGEVETYEEFVARWKEDYPDEFNWYRIVIAEGFNQDGSLRYRGVSIGNKMVISADMDCGTVEEKFEDDAAFELCGIMAIAANESIQKLRDGVYNDEVNNELPYGFRTGVIKRADVWKKEPEDKQSVLEGLPEESVEEFKSLVSTGANDEMKIGRLSQMTANDFFRACSIGYKACGFEDLDRPLAEQYLKYADGRDEGLTGRGDGLNAGTGIDFDDPEAWAQWYFNGRLHGGHPWEVVRGGNSTHVDLFVCHDQHSIGWKVATGRITQEEAEQHPNGYYFSISGKHRTFETVSFYVALSKAGLPVILHDADAILARIEGTDYIGIVPHHVIPKYCEDMFPEKYGRVIDFMRVYDEEYEEFGDAIEWLPMEEAELKNE